MLHATIIHRSDIVNFKKELIQNHNSLLSLNVQYSATYI